VAKFLSLLVSVLPLSADFIPGMKLNWTFHSKLVAELINHHLFQTSNLQFLGPSLFKKNGIIFHRSTPMGQCGVSPCWLCAEHRALLPGLVQDTRKYVDAESTTVADLRARLCLPDHNDHWSAGKFISTKS
jgi:hypothetical protein